ncbi:MAG: hypothetical protein M0030_12155 [Actinomycetota bacterium]|nr:hypothetical protein [Actinomycetota bacterium]
MAENELLKSEVEIVGTEVLPLELDPEFEVVDDEQAAARMATLAAIDVQASVFVTCCKKTTRFLRWPEKAAIQWRQAAGPQRLLR